MTGAMKARKVGDDLSAIACPTCGRLGAQPVDARHRLHRRLRCTVAAGWIRRWCLHCGTLYSLHVVGDEWVLTGTMAPVHAVSGADVGREPDH